MTRRSVAIVERSEPFRAFRIEEGEEGEGPKGRMVDIGLSDLNEGELVVGTRYSHWIPSMGRHAADGIDEAVG